METERLPLEQCAGRFLAKDIFAPMDNPPFDRSALDGYAVRSEDIRNASPETPVYLQVCDAAYAGRPSSHRVEKGCALRIMTGAVTRRPRIALLSTGDELCLPGAPLLPGKIYNSSLYVLAARLRQLGAEPVIIQMLKDDPQAATRRIREIYEMQQADFIITTGGVSVGQKDILHQTAAMCGGDIIFWRLKIKPGSPVMFWRLGDLPVLSLSGNPFAAFATFDLLARPALDKLLGTASLSLCEGEAVIASAFKENTGLRRFVRGHFCNGTVSLPEGHSSGLLLSLSGCNCLVNIPPNSPALHPGDRVTILAVCGIKNSGKTTLLTKITAQLSSEGMKIAVIKHDGHSFQPDRPGTDSFRHKEAGAYATAVFCFSCFSLVKDTNGPVDEASLFAFFPEADLILLEGFKYSHYPKIEVMRSAVSRSPASNQEHLVAVVSDVPPDPSLHTRHFFPDDIRGICQFIREQMDAGIL